MKLIWLARKEGGFLAPESAPNRPVGDVAWFEELAARKPPTGHPFAEPPSKRPSRGEVVQTAFFLLAMLAFVTGMGRGKGFELFRLVLTAYGW